MSKTQEIYCIAAQEVTLQCLAERIFLPAGVAGSEMVFPILDATLDEALLTDTASYYKNTFRNYL